MLVFRRIHVAAELVGSEPKLGFEADVGGGVVFAISGASSHARAAVLSGEMRKRKDEARELQP